jgi:hypothetical protein
MALMVAGTVAALNRMTCGSMMAFRTPCAGTPTKHVADAVMQRHGGVADAETGQVGAGQ